MVSAKFVLEARIAAFGHGVLAVPDHVGRIDFLLGAAAPIVIDQRDVIQAAAVLMQVLGAVGSIHHIGSIPDTCFTLYSGDIVDTFGPTGCW